MIYRIFLCVLATGFMSCSTDFDLTTGDLQNVPVIYALLNAEDEFHYVRVEKAFIDEEISPIELAEDSNSVFYDNVTVELMKGNESVVLNMVDAADIGMPRDSGIFLSEPNYLYRISDSEFNITDHDIVSVRVTFPSDTLVASATTPIVGKCDLDNPNPNPDNQGTIGLAPGAGVDEFLRWDNDIDTRFVDMYFKLHIREFRNNNTEFRELLWPIFKGLDVIPEDNIGERFKVNGGSFFNFLNVTLEADPNVTRKLDSCDIIIDAGGEALFRFIEVNNLNTGITSSQVVPNYTNVNNGLGLFSSTSRLVETGFRFEPITIDELVTHPAVADLNFIR